MVIPELSTPDLEGVVDLARRVASIPRVPILIVAEQGGPTESLARLIHFESGDKSLDRWISVQPSDRPEAHVDAELFGIDGRDEDPSSALHRALGGTLFIDSVHCLSSAAQARLSAVLPDPLVAPPAIPRVIAGASINLREAVQQGRFRNDLLRRLSTITITIPPLRRRPRDIMVLATYFAGREAEALGKPFDGFSRDAQTKLSLHTYPGNESELLRAIKGAMAAMTGKTIVGLLLEFQSLPETCADVFVKEIVRQSEDEKGRVPSLSEIERAYVIWALRYTNLNRSAAARVLGISYPTMAKRISAYGIDIATLGKSGDGVIK